MKTNPYEQKRRWKFFLLAFAILFGVASIVYTQYLAKKIALSERTRAEVWARSIQRLVETEDSEFLGYIQTVRDSLIVPAIITDSIGEIKFSRGLDSTKAYIEADTLNKKKFDLKYFKRQLNDMKEQHTPIVINFFGKKQYVYYKDSFLLLQLKYFPYIQLAVIAAFLLAAYSAFNSARRAEQNQVWVGMAKETAHQLGTPISSLMAWSELLKSKFDAQQDPLFAEMEVDIRRLEIVADRFSKIGSKPVLENFTVFDEVLKFVHYFKVRVSDKITFEVTGDEQVQALLNAPLFDWVIENLLKNGVNAIEAPGKITINISDNIAKAQVYIDINDTGKGIPRSKFDAIFQPGYTTRKRGWGLGLSLTKRIVEGYHQGQIFVKESEIGKGTTFRIILKSSLHYEPATS